MFSSIKYKEMASCSQCSSLVGYMLIQGSKSDLIYATVNCKICCFPYKGISLQCYCLLALSYLDY